MKTAYLSSAYLAPVEYYTKLLAYDKIFIEQHDHYMKQTYRTGRRTGSLYPHRKARYTEMPNERYPDFRPRQLETPALERY